MKEVLNLWIKDKFQLTIWLLLLSLLTLTWPLLPKIQLVQKFFEQPRPILAPLLLSSLAINIAISLSFIRFLYQNKDVPKQANKKKDLSSLSLEILKLIGSEGDVSIATQAFANNLGISFNKAQCAIDELLDFSLLSSSWNIGEESSYFITSDGRRFLSKNNLL